MAEAMRLGVEAGPQGVPRRAHPGEALRDGVEPARGPDPLMSRALRPGRPTAAADGRARSGRRRRAARSTPACRRCSCARRTCPDGRSWRSPSGCARATAERRALLFVNDRRRRGDRGRRRRRAPGRAVVAGRRRARSLPPGALVGASVHARRPRPRRAPPTSSSSVRSSPRRRRRRSASRRARLASREAVAPHGSRCWRIGGITATNAWQRARGGRGGRRRHPRHPDRGRPRPGDACTPRGGRGLTYPWMA